MDSLHLDMVLSKIKRINCKSYVPGEMQKVHWRWCSDLSLKPFPHWEMNGHLL